MEISLFINFLMAARIRRFLRGQFFRAAGIRCRFQLHLHEIFKRPRLVFRHIQFPQFFKSVFLQNDARATVLPRAQSPVLEELTARLADAVQNSIRRGDALCQYGKGQYLVLLVNTTRENCAVVQKRINRRFIQGRQRSGIEYYVNSVFWEAPEDSEGGGLLDG